MNQAVLKLIAHLKSEPWNQLIFERILELLKSEANELAKQDMTIQLFDAIEIINPSEAFLLLSQLIAAYPTHLPVLIKLKEFFSANGKKAKAFAVELEIAKLQPPKLTQALTVLEPLEPSESVKAPVSSEVPLTKPLLEKTKLSWNDVAVAPSLNSQK